MKKFIKPAIFIVIGIIIAFPLFSLSYYTMVRTSTPEFCASCHEIKPAVVAANTFDFFFAKTYHGIKDVALHFFVDEYDQEKARNNAYAAFRNSECQKCHRNLLNMPYKRGAMLAHRSVLYARPGKH
jgi:cytochrome c-type protein NapC/trimethylamine-N-oxide reductase cytochrome c-type subunit TorC